MASQPIFAWHMQQTTLLIGQCLHHLFDCCIPGSNPSHFRKLGKNNVDWGVVVFKYYRSPSTDKLFGTLPLHGAVCSSTAHTTSPVKVASAR